MNGTLFYVLGIGLAVFAVFTSLVGLRAPGFPRSNAAMVALIVIFAVIVGGATSFAVLHARDEQRARAAEQAPATTGGGGGAAAQGEKPPTAQPKASGKGGTVKLAAKPTQIAYDTKSLATKPGKVTIDFTNPSVIQHDVAIAQNGKQIAVSTLIASGSTSVSADLAPGTYTFFCTVPGHRQAGMQGTLTVK